MHPHGTPLDPAPGVGMVQSEVPADVPESSSDSWAPQMLLGATEEPALGSPGHMQAQDYRFSSSWVPQMLLDATEELRMECWSSGRL